MVDIPGDSTTDATITVGGALEGDLEVAADHDWYQLQLTAGQQVTIFLTGTTLEDPYLRVRDSAGNILFENDDINAGLARDSRITYTATSTGTYYVDVAAWVPDDPLPGYTGTGTYQLSIQPYTPPPEFSIDQVSEFLASGYWGGDSHPFAVTQGGSITVNVTALSAAGQNLALTALDYWSDIIGVSFVPVTTGGQITFDDNESGAFADSIWADGVTTSSHINVSVTWLSDYGTQIGGYAFQAYVHEIGHALGLGHAGYYNETADYLTDAEYSNDGWPTSIMSYFSQNESTYFNDQGFLFLHVVTPMLGDIAAMELLYGLSTNTRADNTTYGYNGIYGDLYDDLLNPAGAYTIFDSGGIDTLDYSQAVSASVINLTPGTFSNINGALGSVAIAHGVIIENAISGDGDDRIIVNVANNHVDGGYGYDTVSYETAAAGVTVSLAVTSAQDTGGAGIDTLLNFEHLVGSSFDDVLTGSLSGNIIGGGGDDVLIAGSNGSSMEGGAGNDLFIPSARDDWIEGGEGFDTVDFSNAAGPVGNGANSSQGHDSLFSIESIIGSDFGETIYGGEATHLDGGGGDDVLWAAPGIALLTGGAGADTFTTPCLDSTEIRLPISQPKTGSSLPTRIWQHSHFRCRAPRSLIRAARSRLKASKDISSLRRAATVVST